MGQLGVSSPTSRHRQRDKQQRKPRWAEDIEEGEEEKIGKALKTGVGGKEDGKKVHPLRMILTFQGNIRLYHAV